MPIYFYSALEEPYGCFSNFSQHGFTLDDVYWPTSEHYFQAQKFANTPHEEKVRLAPTAKRSAQMGRERTRPLRADWEGVKEDVMRDALLAKFRAHDAIRDVLFGTGDETLIEKTTGDYYWGIGTQGTGKNRLGILLMEVRETLRAETKA